MNNFYSLSGDRPDVTGRTAAEELVRGVRSGGCVDEHLQDQVTVRLY